MTWPSYVMFLTSNGGKFASQLPFFASSSSDASTPCSANWRTAIPMFHCIAVGGLSAAACSACGPTDASSTQVPPRLLYSFANTATARDSPPLVHQCMTSAFCATAWPTHSVPASAVATAMVLNIGSSRGASLYATGYNITPLFTYHCQANLPPAWSMSSAIFSAAIMVGKLVFAHGTTGNIEASTTRSPCTPRTLPAWSVTAIGSSSAPMRQEHEQCHTPTAARLM